MRTVVVVIIMILLWLIHLFGETNEVFQLGKNEGS